MKTINRATKLGEIDPAWAWEPWEPSAEEPWDEKRAAHMFRRAAFCASESQIRSALSRSPQAAIDELFAIDDARIADAERFESESRDLARAIKATGDVKQLASWWLHRMLNSPQPMIEKLTLFWHGHFATGAEKVIDVELMQTQNQLLREHAQGDFRVMVHGIAKDPAMLIYLDSVTNRKAHANENFARELMELFCLGEGNYSEADVQQLARCFTGWEIRRKRFRFNPYQHDDGLKTLLGAQVESGEEAVDTVLASEHLPFFITRKLFRFFVCDEPSPSKELLAPLAKQFSADNLSLKGMLRTLMGSRLMLSNWSLGRKVRSPVELAIGLLRTLEGSTNLYQLSDQLRVVGQAIFYPPNVKGWDGGRAWVNSSTLVGRANLIHQMIRQENSRFDGGNLASFYQTRAAGSPEKFLDWFSGLFLAVPLSDEQKASLINTVQGSSPEKASREMLSLLAALPQIQLS